MSQPIDLSKLRALYLYHVKLKELWKRGELDHKVKHLLKVKAQEIGISIDTYNRRKKELTTN